MAAPARAAARRGWGRAWAAQTVQRSILAIPVRPRNRPRNQRPSVAAGSVQPLARLAQLQRLEQLGDGVAQGDVQRGIGRAGRLDHVTAGRQDVAAAIAVVAVVAAQLDRPRRRSLRERAEAGGGEVMAATRADVLGAPMRVRLAPHERRAVERPSPRQTSAPSSSTASPSSPRTSTRRIRRSAADQPAAVTHACGEDRLQAGARVPAHLARHLLAHRIAERDG